MARKRLTPKQTIALATGLGAVTLLASGLITYGAIVVQTHQIKTNTAAINQENNQAQVNVANLTRNVQQDQATLAQNQATLNTLNGTIQTDRKDVATAQAKVQAGQTQVQSLEALKATNTTKIQTIQSQATKDTAEITQLQTTIGTLQTEWQGMQKQIAPLQTKINQLTTALTTAKTALTTVKTQLNQVSAQLTQTNQQLTQAQTAQKTDRTTLQTIQNQITTIQQTNAGLQAALKTNISGAKATAMEQEIAQNDKMLTQLQAKAIALDKSIAQATTQITTLTRDKATLTQKLTTLQTQLTTLNGQATQLQDELTAETGRYNQEVQALTTAEASLKTAQDDLTTAQAKYQDAQTQIKTLTTAKATATSEVAGLTTQAKTLEGQITTLNGEIKATVSAQTVQHLENEVATDQQDLQTTQAKINQLQGEITQDTAAMNTANEQIQTLTPKIRQDQATITQDTTQITGLKQQIAASTPLTVYDALKQQEAAIQGQINQDAKTIQTLTGTYTQDQSQITNLTKQNQTLTGEIGTDETTIKSLIQQLQTAKQNLAQANAAYQSLTAKSNTLNSEISADTQAEQNIPLYFTAYQTLYTYLQNQVQMNAFGQVSNQSTLGAPTWNPIPAPGYKNDWQHPSNIGTNLINLYFNLYDIFESLYSGYYPWFQISNPTQTDWSGHYLNNAADQQTWTFTNWLYNHLQSSIFFNHRNTSVSENFPFDYFNDTDGLNPLFQTSNYELTPDPGTTSVIGSRTLSYTNTLQEPLASTLYSTTTGEVPFFQSYTNEPIGGTYDFDLTRAQWLYDNFFFPNQYNFYADTENSSGDSGPGEPILVNEYAVWADVQVNAAGLHAIPEKYQHLVLGHGGRYHFPYHARPTTPIPEPVYQEEWTGMGFGSGFAASYFTLLGYSGTSGAGIYAWNPNPGGYDITSIQNNGPSDYSASPMINASYVYYNNTCDNPDFMSWVQNIDGSTTNLSTMTMSSGHDAIDDGNDHSTALNGGFTAELYTEYMNYFLDYMYQDFIQGGDSDANYLNYLETIFGTNGNGLLIAEDINNFFVKNEGSNFFGNAWSFANLYNGGTGQGNISSYEIKPAMMMYQIQGNFYRTSNLFTLEPFLACTTSNPNINDGIYYDANMNNNVDARLTFDAVNMSCSSTNAYFVGDYSPAEAANGPEACSPFNNASSAFSTLNPWVACYVGSTELWNTPNLIWSN